MENGPSKTVKIIMSIPADTLPVGPAKCILVLLMSQSSFGRRNFQEGVRSFESLFM